MTQAEQFPISYYDNQPLPAHPGVNSAGRREPPESFEGFRAFVNTQGLNPDVAKVFDSLLATLFQRTGNRWIPGLCMYAVDVAAQAKAAVKELMPGARVDLMLHLEQLNTHTWTQLELPNQSALVIDPAGVYNLDSRILPYFGPISPCIVGATRFRSAEQVYLTSFPLSPVQEAKIVAANRKYLK